MEKKLNYQEPALIELESLFEDKYIVIGDSSCTAGGTEGLDASEDINNALEESDWE